MIFDCEGNSLTPTKFHVLSYMSDDGIVSLTTHKGMKEWLLKQEVLIGHNIIRWDVPNLERVLKIEIKAKLVDTLALSWYLYDGRDKHGLESWGEDLNVEKPEIKDWKNLTLEEYVHRCEEDVKINYKLWKKQSLYLQNLYGHIDVVNLPIVAYLSFKLKCAALQEECKWRIDKDKINTNLDFLNQKKEEKEAVLVTVMPQVPVYKIYSYPAKPFKKNGELSTHGENWKARCESLGLTFDHKESIKIVSGYEAPNPSSPVQVKAWLFSLGWKPKTFKYEKEEDGTLRTIPQVKKPFEPEFCDSVKKLYEIEPKLEELEGLSIINHRISTLNSILEKEENGYVKAEIGGLTNTLRFKHIKPCVNLPGNDKLYGEYIRSAFIADDGYELCGSDMTALENKTGDHYIYSYDPDYVAIKNNKNYDPHLEICVKAGLMTTEEESFYKWYKEKK